MKRMMTRRRMYKPDKETDEQKILRCRKNQNAIRMKVLRIGIAGVLIGEELNTDDMGPIRILMIDLEDAITAAEKSSDAYYATYPYRIGRRVTINKPKKKVKKEKTK